MVGDWWGEEGVKVGNIIMMVVEPRIFRGGVLLYYILPSNPGFMIVSVSCIDKALGVVNGFSSAIAVTVSDIRSYLDDTRARSFHHLST